MNFAPELAEIILKKDSSDIDWERVDKILTSNPNSDPELRDAVLEALIANDVLSEESTGHYGLMKDDVVVGITACPWRHYFTNMEHAENYVAVCHNDDVRDTHIIKYEFTKLKNWSSIWRENSVYDSSLAEGEAEMRSSQYERKRAADKKEQKNTRYGGPPCHDDLVG